MRRRDREATDPGAALDVLARGEVVRVAMTTEDGRPYLVPLSYALAPPSAGGPLRLLVHGAPEGRKIAALRRDPRVCFEVTVDVALRPAERACDVGVAYRCVIGDGRARFLEDPAERAEALSLLAARYARSSAPVAAEQAGGVAVIEIRVESLSCKISPAPPPR
jgi:nitroimidazol reductase NimA-like FMN-containing flavoprotein (pyridoxamine 5'-phosphate oxidase superfamily)